MPDGQRAPMPIQIASHTWGFNDLTLPEALGTIARMGFRYVDLGTGPHLNTARAANPATRGDALNEISSDLALFNLKVADVYLLLPRISAEDEARRSADITLFKALLPFAKALGAPGITLSPGLAAAEADAGAFDRTAEALNEMMAVAQKIALPLSIEPHLDSIAPTPEHALRFVQAVPGLQITLDIAHMVCQRIKPKDMWALLPYTRHVQLRQAKAKRLQTPFDKGSIDLAEVVAALKAAQYGGFISIELLQTINWHGTQPVNSLLESMRLRDALRLAWGD